MGWVGNCAMAPPTLPECECLCLCARWGWEPGLCVLVRLAGTAASFRGEPVCDLGMELS